MKRQQLDAGSEVGEIKAAVEGVRILIDLMANDAVPNAETERALPRSASALLNVIGARLKAFAQSLNSTRNPVELVEPFNHALGEGGTTIRAWSPEKREQEAQRQLRRLSHERPSRSRR